MGIKTVVTNRKAYHNYLIQDRVEAGIVLTGTEIKSIRSGRVSLGDAYVRPEGGELWLLNKQIDSLTSMISEKGLTLVPLRLYIKDSIAKVEVALGKGKKLYDKRESIIRRETEREIGRAIKGQKRR